MLGGEQEIASDDVATVLGLRPTASGAVVPPAGVPAPGSIPLTAAYRAARQAAARQAMLLGHEVQLLSSSAQECRELRPLSGEAADQLATAATRIYGLAEASLPSYDSVLKLYRY